MRLVSGLLQLDPVAAIQVVDQFRQRFPVLNGDLRARGRHDQQKTRCDDGPFHPGPVTGEKGPVIYEVDYVRIWTDTLSTKPAPSAVAVTKIETSKPLLTDSQIKAKKKVVYGKKSDHRDEGVFFSFFQSLNAIQVYSLGNFKSTKPVLIIKDNTGKEILKQEIGSQITTLPTTQMKNGDYELLLEYGGKMAGDYFRL